MALLTTIDALDFSEVIRPGDTVLWGQGCSEPTLLARLLLSQRARIGRFQCFIGFTLSDTVHPDHGDYVQFISYTGYGGNRALDRAKALHVVPCNYSQLPSLFASGRIPIDVVLLQVAPPDRDGVCSFGLAEDYLPAAIQCARTVIAQVNEQVPRTIGGGHVAYSEMDVVVQCSSAPITFAYDAPDEAEAQVARAVAGLIDDKATLQIGLGSLPAAVLQELGNRRNLGVHSGLVTDAVADLMDAGVITNTEKTLDPGITITGMLVGSERLFRFASDNPAIQTRDVRYTHDPSVLAAQAGLVAINSAIEVDLTGQVNAEVAGGHYLGGVGGAGDFLRGAQRSRGGVPVVALTSTTGDRSRVVAELEGPVTTARADVGFVVTEFGIADLRGLSVQVRRERMLALAAPHFRKGLEERAEALNSGREP
jgi:acetyl-CoA hydrolase